MAITIALQAVDVGSILTTGFRTSFNGRKSLWYGDNGSSILPVRIKNKKGKIIMKQRIRICRIIN